MKSSLIKIVTTVALTLIPAAWAWGQINTGAKGEIVYNPRYGDDEGELRRAILDLKPEKLRDDILWHAEAANVVYPKAGNVSLLSATRYGVTDKLELSTYIVEDVMRPTIYAKLLWGRFGKHWFASSRFDIANAYSGMKLGQRLEVERICPPDVKVPLVFELGHELLVSRAWYTDQNCSDGSVYFILTGGIGLYGSFIASRGDTIEQPRFHFMANRSETLIDKGFRARFKIWADGRLTNRIYAHGGVAYHTGFFSKHHAVELQAEGEYFFKSYLSGKLGVLASFAHYKGISNHAAAWPIIDVTYYFGKRNKRNESNLFNNTMTRRKRLKSKHYGSDFKYK